MDRIDYLVNSHTILTCLLLQLFTNSASTRLDIFTHLNLVMPMKRKFPTRILAYLLYRAQTSCHSQSHQGQQYIDEHSSRETTHKTTDALSLKAIIRLFNERNILNKVFKQLIYLLFKYLSISILGMKITQYQVHIIVSQILQKKAK